MSALRAYVLCYPAVLLLSFYMTWVAGRFALGYWPRPSLDDPGLIGMWVDIPYTITFLLLIVGLPAFIVGVIALLYRAFTDEARRTSLITISVLSVMCMIDAIAVSRWDPFGVVEWYMD